MVRDRRHGVEVEFCPACKGVWLDRGELDKIIEAATPPVVLPDPSPPAAQPEERPHARARGFSGAKTPGRGAGDKPHHAGRRYGGRFSRGEFRDFLEDLFDFD